MKVFFIADTSITDYDFCHNDVLRYLLSTVEAEKKSHSPSRRFASSYQQTQPRDKTFYKYDVDGDNADDIVLCSSKCHMAGCTPF